MVYHLEKKDCAAPLFGDWEETMIRSCLHGVMGHIYADDEYSPAAAMAILGDFCFFAGQPNQKLAAFKPDWCSQDFIIAVPQSGQWAELIEKCYAGRCKKVVRYAMKKEPDVFDKGRLEELVRGLSPEYTLQIIDEPMYTYCKKEEWCRDLVSLFPEYPFYEKYGLGVVAVRQGIPVSGASSYSAFPGGIEIEIDTKAEYRRKGLATACGAKLILECLARGLYPSWDAQNLWSVALAEKLGYHFDYAYDAYEIYGY